MTSVRLKAHPSPHPFVHKRMVAPLKRPPRSGEVVTLVAPDGTVLGDGFYNAVSDITLRRLTDGDVRFDQAALEGALDRAARLREGLPGLAESTNAWRAIHPEGDRLSGLVADVLGDVVALELYSAGWIGRLDEVAATLCARVGVPHWRATLEKRVARLEGVKPLARSSPGAPDRVTVTEHGVRYKVDFASGHKTGFFCDQRENRLEFARWLQGDVLDVCCYTGGFSLCGATHGNGASFTAVDLDEKALEVARRNGNQNQKRIKWTHADAFDWMRQVGNAGRRFDSIVVDPPKFIPSRSEMERGCGKYHDLNKLALSLLAPGGRLLTCSCSGLLSREALRDLVQSAARKLGRSATILRWTGAAPDHPVLLECPETEYLKAVWMQVW